MSTAIHQMWVYNDWANRRLLDALIATGNDLPYSCLHLISHIVNTQVVWLSRMQGLPVQVGPWDDHGILECKALHERSSAGLRSWLETNVEGFTYNITYTNTSGVSYQNNLQDILLHTFNHATYHRAQIAMELRRNGFEPPVTDYIHFMRD
ncbi:DinB family protein [Arcticibacter sp.]|uniref:DinB family protein n=1 Tax=Arcticibacter sp. TaxID=1872630 RepID=UPI00388E505C